MTLALITARGGSKGIPRKNIRELAGKPLIAWTIEAALGASSVSKVVVSTDDEEIAEISKTFGAEVPFLRPAALADDTATSQDVVAHACEQLAGFGDLVLLQPTSPLRTAAHIDEIIRMSAELDVTSATSVTKVSKHPALMYHRGEAGEMIPYSQLEKATRRQDLVDLYCLNGAMYWVDVQWFLARRTFVDHDTRAYLMEAADSVDIDDMLDWKIAEMLLQERQNALR